MRILRIGHGTQHISLNAPSAITIGNFDGMHLGHQSLFRVVQRRASESSTPLTRGLVTFYPHPKRYFSGRRGRERCLTPLREKVRLAADYGFDFVACIRFDRRVASMSPEEFVQEYLLKSLQAKSVVVGHDFGFGRDRSGTTASLLSIGTEEGFSTDVVEPYVVNGTRVSSSRIREHVSRGELADVESFLGRRYGVVGRVIHGDKRGRTIGFPTANLQASAFLLPSFGVYATNAFLGAKRFPAVTNVGMRPTVFGDKPLVETHLLDGESPDLYGQRLRVEFASFIRPEQRFHSIELLKDQIVRDCADARQFHQSD